MLSSQNETKTTGSAPGEPGQRPETSSPEWSPDVTRELLLYSPYNFLLKRHVKFLLRRVDMFWTTQQILTLIWKVVQNYVAVRLRVILYILYMTPKATNRREGGLTSCCGRSLKLRAFTQKELCRDGEGSSKTAWSADYWLGECPGRGLWLRELKEANKPLSWLKYTKMAPKTVGLQCFLA